MLPAVMPPPPGVVPNFDNPHMHVYWETIVVCAYGWATIVLMVSSLMAARIHLVKRLFLDDYFLLAALVLNIPVTFLALQSYKYGLGVHMWELTVDKPSKLFQLSYYNQLLYVPCYTFAKIAIMLQLKRIFVPHGKTKSYYILCLFITINALNAISNFLTKTFQCSPREKAWNFMMPGKCIKFMISQELAAYLNLITDAVLLTLLFLWLRRMHLSKRRKFGIGAIFATGVMSCLACAVRCFAVGPKMGTSDKTYWLAEMNIWMLVHTCTSIQCAALPSFPSFLKLARGKIDSTIATASSRFGKKGSSSTGRTGTTQNSTGYHNSIISVDPIAKPAKKAYITATPSKGDSHYDGNSTTDLTSSTITRVDEIEMASVYIGPPSQSQRAYYHAFSDENESYHDPIMSRDYSKVSPV